MGEGNKPQRQFTGEVRLMQELYFLAEDKRRPVVYFTQGHGEPDEASPARDVACCLDPEVKLSPVACA